METLFSPTSSKGPAPNHNDLVASYRASFAAHPVSKYGTPLRPLVLPYHLYGMLLLLLYLLIPHTQSPIIYAARWPVLGVILWWQWKTLWETTSMSMATAFAAGLVSAFGAVFAVTWLILERPQWEAWRVERRLKGKGKGDSGKSGDVGEAEEDHGDIRQANGHTTGHVTGSVGHKDRGKATGQTNGKVSPSPSSKIKDEYEYFSQSYPTTLPTRISWVFDLLINFRGPGWNWAIPPLPPLPAHIARQIGQSITARHESGISPVGLQRHDNRQELARAILPKFTAGYFVLDILKVVMMKDPYFIIGPNVYDLPPHLQGFSPLTLRLIRQSLSSFAILTSLSMVFSFAPILLSLILGPRYLGLRGEPWYYTTSWGSFSNITTRGLNGLWGGWWHQIFRLIFSSPTAYLIRHGFISPNSPAGKIVALLFAFGISSILHTAGSISQFPKTEPMHASMFFMSQALGIVIQMLLCAALKPVINKFPKQGVVRQAGNFLFVFTWLLCTAPWLTDDFARGGIWLYEPIPLSPLRGLGLGGRGDGLFCWKDHWGVRWYKGDRWWESGLAI